MPEWVIWGILWFALFRLFRRRGYLGACGRGRMHRWDCEWREPRVRDRESPGPTAQLAQMSPLEALQRRFVSGSISLEEYESELDQLMRLRG